MSPRALQLTVVVAAFLGCGIASASSPAHLYDPKQPGETSQAFFERAAKEVRARATVAPGKLSPQGDAALNRLANAAGMRAVRTMVVGGGVQGSQSGNGYVTYYRDGWNSANGF